MLMNIIKAHFCVNFERFQGAEVILKELFHHLPLPKASQQGSTDASKISSPYKHQLLSFKIKNALRKQVDSKIISQSVADELNNMFDPHKGIKINKQIQKSQANRFNQAKNQKDLFPLFPDSALSCVLMRRYYKLSDQKIKQTQITQQDIKVQNDNNVNTSEKDKVNKEADDRDRKLQDNSRSNNGEHFVGTPGLGKTFRFLQLAKLHDLRIKHIIEAGDTPADSLFLQNYKFVYFNVEAQQQEIKKTLIQKIKEDFGEKSMEFQKLNKLRMQQDQDNLLNFYKAVALHYGRKNIKIRLIIDQVNNLYRQILQPKQVDKIVRNWNGLFRRSGGSGTLISSKNNDYRRIADPALRIMGLDYGNQNIMKTILDNYIGPVDRLIYSAESLLFELEKQNVPKVTGKTAFSIVKNLEKQLPFITHYSYSKAVTESIKKYKAIKHDSKDFQSILIKCLQSNDDRAKLLKNVKQFETKIQAKEKKDLQYAIPIMANLISFTNKAISCQVIKVDLNVDDQRYSEKLQLSSQIVSRESSKEQQRKMLNLLKNANFFFLAMDGDVQKMYFSHSPSYLSRLRFELINDFTIDFQKKLIEHMAKNALLLIGEYVGEIFELFILKAYHQYRSRNRLAYNIIRFENQEKLITLDSSTISDKIFPSIMEWSFIDEIPKLSQLVLSKSYYMRAFDGNPVFDFLLSTFKEQKLTLFFVDATISSDVSQKKIRFVRFLSGNKLNPMPKKNIPRNKILDGLTAFINHLETIEEIKEIEIYFYVLKADNEIRTEQTTKKKKKDQYAAPSKDVTAEFHKIGIFTNENKVTQDKVKLIKILHGVIDKDFLLSSNGQSDLTSTKINSIMKPALEYFSKNSNPQKRKQMMDSQDYE